MSDVIEVSYTGDLLAHRRCARAWAYEKYAGFHPYEQIQAMEGRLIHHAMEWLTRFRKEQGRNASRDELKDQLQHYFRVLWARGVRTAFTSKEKTLERVLNNLFPLPKGAGDSSLDAPRFRRETVRSTLHGFVGRQFARRSAVAQEVEKGGGHRPATGQARGAAGEVAERAESPLPIRVWDSRGAGVRRAMAGKGAQDP